MPRINTSTPEHLFFVDFFIFPAPFFTRLSNPARRRFKYKSADISRSDVNIFYLSTKTNENSNPLPPTLFRHFPRHRRQPLGKLVRQKRISIFVTHCSPQRRAPSEDKKAYTISKVENGGGLLAITREFIFKFALKSHRELLSKVPSCIRITGCLLESCYLASPFRRFGNRRTTLFPPSAKAAKAFAFDLAKN